MSGCVCVDGEFLAPGDATVPASAHGVLYGDGVFETLRTYGGAPFRLDAHLDRLDAGAATLGIGDLPDRLTLTAWLGEALDRSGLEDTEDAMIRVTVLRGAGAGPDPRTCGPSAAVVAVLPLRVPTEGLRSRGLHLRTVEAPVRTLPPPSVKSTSYQAAVLARGSVSPADDALWAHSGVVRETTTANVFAIAGGKVLTPPTAVCLAGVTRAEILDIATREGLPIAVGPLTLDRLLAADEAFVTSSLVEVLPVTEVDGSAIGTGDPGPRTRRLHDAYLARTGSVARAGGAG